MPAMASAREQLSLDNLFIRAETPEVLIKFLKEDLRLKNIADLISYTAKNSYEEEWKEIIAGGFPLRPQVAARDAVEATESAAARPAVPADPGFGIADQRLLIGRMRTTARIAFTVEDDAAEDKAAARKEQYEADMEKPLDGETRARYKRQWTSRHGWEPVPSMRGAPKLRNRVVREWANLGMTNHTVEKAVSSLQAKRPIEPDRVPVGPAGAQSVLIYERERPQTRTVNTVLEYIAALRLLVGVYAFCGTDMVSSKKVPGTTVEFFGWEIALGYADNALHKVLEVAIAESQKLAWLRRRDERTRAKMAHHINQGMPGGEALQLAWQENLYFWDMEDRATLIETRDEKPASLKRGRSRSKPRAASGSKGGGQDLTSTIKYAQFDNSKKRKLCGKYNSKSGACATPCRNGLLHVCSVIKPNGKVCEAKDHGAWRCPYAGRG